MDYSVEGSGGIMRKKERAMLVTQALWEMYPEVKCSLNYTTPVEMLIATQMSAQCTDASVNRVTETLFKKYTSVEDFAKADLLELQEDIRSIGLYRNKAKNIILCCQRLLEVYGGEVPDTMEELLTLPGTGRKTANLVLGDVFGKPAVVVDTHCIRISGRIGLTKETDPKKIEEDLKKLIPPEKQLGLCHRFVYHGRSLCNARSPKCSNCRLSELGICQFFEKQNKKK